MNHEEWKPVIGYVGIYEVSSHGRIRKQTDKGWKQINPYVTTSGHLMVGLHKFKKRTQLMMHRIVAEAFIGPIPNKMLVHHKDTDKTNNRKDNLEIVTTRFNTQHACDTGLIKHAKGEKHGRAKLTEADVREIRRRAAFTNDFKLSRMFGVSPTHIADVVARKFWKHVE